MHVVFRCTKKSAVAIATLLMLGLFATGCDRSSDGDNGAPGAPGASTGTLSGRITNSLTPGTGVAGATVETDPAVAGGSTTTDGNGDYTLTVPVGNYTVKFGGTHYTEQSVPVSILAGVTTTNDVKLVPTAPVVVSAGSGLSGTPGGSVFPVGSYTILDGSTVQSIQWTQTNSVDVVISGQNTLTPTVTLPNLQAYKNELIHFLMEPPIAAEDLPPTVELPEGEFPGGLPNRFMVVGLNHFAIEEAGHVGLELVVTTTSGTYRSTGAIEAHLPFKPTTSLRNVPVGIPVLLHGVEQNDYDWNLSLIPGNSGATLTDPLTRDPWFVPDVVGTYEVTVTEDSTNLPVILTITAGLWDGGITSDTDGNPVMGECFQCHSTFLRETFDDWAKTGHANIFSDNLDTSTHYGKNCFGCHTVGFDEDVANGGFDDANGYAAFLAAGLLNNPGSNWVTMLAQFSEVANKANIQCENCHGPNDSLLHADGNLGAARVSLSSDICGSCHGEPLRHSRFQQWQLSPHANYELAIDEGGSSNCSRCHTANGFVAWQDLGFDPDARPTVDWDENDVHPQTCVACHDPHKQGTTSGEPNTATVRVTGDTPMLMAGFQALDVGRGAVCMVCHNSRRGLINDQAVPVADDEAPHRGAQGDMLMGQNAYFVQTGVRGKHSLITDTCSNCHMEQTPPPDLLAYQGGGTSHTFRASKDICMNCHDSITAEEVQSSVKAQADALAAKIEAAILTQIEAHLDAGNTVEVWDRPRSGTPTLLVAIQPGDLIVVSNYYENHQDVDLTVNGDLFEEVGIDNIEVNGGAFSEGSSAAQVIVKSGWNLLQVRVDGSYGIHNPTWALQILAAAMNTLDNTDLTEVPAE